MLEVDIDYSNHNLQDFTYDYPLFPEKSKLLGQTSSKINLTCNDKKNYVIHGQTLKTYLSIHPGIRVVAIHRILKFDSEPYLKKYIEFNTNIRKECKNDTEKSIPKLQNNALYGKTIENILKRTNADIIEDQKKLQKRINKGKIKRIHPINEKLIVVESHKRTYVINKPVIIGVCILEISKAHMYASFYEMVKHLGRKNIELLYTDTDSLIFRFAHMSKGIFENMTELIHDSELGKFKDELKGEKIIKFIALKPKSYSQVTNEHLKVITKGVNKKQKDYLKFEDFEMCLQNKEKKIMEMCSLRSHKFEMKIQKYKKIALDYWDDKRFWISAVHSLPFGHYSLCSYKEA